jgi:hypothetical protein
MAPQARQQRKRDEESVRLTAVFMAELPVQKKYLGLFGGSLGNRSRNEIFLLAQDHEGAVGIARIERLLD